MLGFAVGPPCWAPLSELYGRRILFLVSHAFVVAFVAASAGANSMASLLVFRFLSGTFGASPMTNSGGVIADLFPPAQRGVALSIFAAAPFLGPVLGPVLGGFVTITVGWRWVEGVCAIFIAVVWLLGAVLVPETYGPLLLKRRAAQLSRQTGQVHISVLEKNATTVTPSDILKRALARPWVLLFREPIVLIASVYLAVVYGTIYMFLGAFSIVYQQKRGWNAGVGGLAFLGLAVGMLFGVAYAIHDNLRYRKLGKTATPESRLPPGMVGAAAMPIGMFLFAFTNGPNIHVSTSPVRDPVCLGSLRCVSSGRETLGNPTRQNADSTPKVGRQHCALRALWVWRRVRLPVVLQLPVSTKPARTSLYPSEACY